MSEFDEADALTHLHDQAHALYEDCRLRSAALVAQELLQNARRAGTLWEYVFALHQNVWLQMGLLAPDHAARLALEMIACVESEERARTIEPDLDEDMYHQLCGTITTCAYDDLAQAAGARFGQNSAGMHECIADGLQICRQVGKLDCTRCFRLYGVEVALAADDLDLARAQCQTLLPITAAAADGYDRSWEVFELLARIETLEGRWSAAAEAHRRAAEVVQTSEVYLPLRTSLLIQLRWKELLTVAAEHLTGARELELNAEPPTTGEWPEYGMLQQRLLALQRTQQGDYGAAIAILQQLDQQLLRQDCLAEWFEVRLRWIATTRLAGDDALAQQLSKGLEARAAEAQDFLTLHRLRVLGAGATHPLALRDSERVTPRTKLPDEKSDALPAGAFSTPPQSASPLGERLAGYMREVVARRDNPDGQRELLETLLAHQAGDVTDRRDAAHLVHLARMLITDETSAGPVWDWASSLNARFPEDATLISMTAALGGQLRRRLGEGAPPGVSAEDLAKKFELSLSLNPQSGPSHLRAGAFYYDLNQLGPAERCFARAFRLDRRDAAAAQQLAEVYRLNNRPRDALAVLDLCLREGATQPEVAWEAAMSALQLEQFDALLTYLNRYEALGGQRPWMHYYRAVALFHAEDWKVCLEELERERLLSPPGEFHLRVIRAAALAGADDLSQAADEMEQLLQLRWGDVHYVSLHGLVQLTEMLWDVGALLPAQSPLREKLETRLLQTGLMPDRYFEDLRSDNPETDQLHFYRLRMHQPLLASWSRSHGCLAGQENWSSYRIDWGVLAETEAEAIDRVHEFQCRCERRPPRLVYIEADGDTFRDRPGIVWQGYRRGAEANERQD